MVTPVSRIIVGFTALFVLQCGIYCACGTASAAFISPCHQAVSTPAEPGFKVEDSDLPSKCAEHHTSIAESSRHAPSTPVPLRHTGEHSRDTCSHCQPSLTAREAGTVVNPIAPATLLGGIEPIPNSSLIDSFGISQFRFLLGLPPPVPCETLLGLHCALTT